MVARVWDGVGVSWCVCGEGKGVGGEGEGHALAGHVVTNQETARACSVGVHECGVLSAECHTHAHSPPLGWV